MRRTRKSDQHVSINYDLSASWKRGTDLPPGKASFNASYSGPTLANSLSTAYAVVKDAKNGPVLSAIEGLTKVMLNAVKEVGRTNRNRNRKWSAT